MAVQTDVRYFKVMGTRQVDSDTVIHFVRQVADFLGNDLPADQKPMEDLVPTPLANEQSRGTIIKITYFSGKTILVNPQS